MQESNYKWVVGILMSLLGVQAIAFLGIMCEWVSLWHGAQDIAGYAAPSYDVTPGFYEIHGSFKYNQWQNPIHLSVLPLTVVNILLILSGVATLVALRQLARAKKS
jgi:hypothetical protein